jgi:hypothetical protein
MMSNGNAGTAAQVGALTNRHANAEGAGSVSGTGADGGGETSTGEVDGGGEAEPPLATDPPRVEGLGETPEPYSIAWWDRQNFPPDIPVLGNILTTTTRAILNGPTGLGKTTWAMAQAWAGAAGKPFLHWGGSGKPRRILYIDSEMSPPHMAAQIKHATRRLGEAPDGLIVWSKMLASFPPLNTKPTWTSSSRWRSPSLSCSTTCATC